MGTFRQTIIHVNRVITTNDGTRFETTWMKIVHDIIMCENIKQSH
jgi:hypothetical protein